MKMKLLLIFIIVLFLAGCNNNDTAKTPPQGNPIRQTTQTPSPTPAIQTPMPMNIAQSPGPVITPSPDYDAGEVLETVLASATTKIYDLEEPRLNNLRIAGEVLNSIVIEPGEIFSFNDSLGQRTKEKGYKEARIIIDNRSEIGIGGGICQVSTTLYQAAKKLNLKIIERHDHTKAVPYAKKGQDASVVYGSWDLKIQNTTNHRLKIKSAMTNNEFTVSLYK